MPMYTIVLHLITAAIIIIHFTIYDVSKKFDSFTLMSYCQFSCSLIYGKKNGYGFDIITSTSIKLCTYTAIIHRNIFNVNPFIKINGENKHLR